MAIGTSIRERILQQLVVAMNAGVEKPGPTYRTRAEALSGGGGGAEDTTGELPAYVLFALDSTPERKSPTTTYHQLTFRLECLMAGEPPMDAALDPMLVYAAQTLFTACEALGMVKGLEEAQIQWEVEPAYDNVAIATADFRVEFATAANDPTTEK